MLPEQRSYQACRHNLLSKRRAFIWLYLNPNVIHLADSLLTSLNHVGCSQRTLVGIFRLPFWALLERMHAMSQTINFEAFLRRKLKVSLLYRVDWSCWFLQHTYLLWNNQQFKQYEKCTADQNSWSKYFLNFAIQLFLDETSSSVWEVAIIIKILHH